MKSYDSFLVRCSLVQDKFEPQHSVFEIEHIQSGAQECVATLAEVQVWIEEKCQAAGFDSDGEHEKANQREQRS